MLMMFILMAVTLTLFIFLTLIFYLLGMKNKSDSYSSCAFECGFSSYFYSRFSFSIHYITITLIFLFLDLEICFILPLMGENYNSFLLTTYFSMIVLVLLGGLIKEWLENKLEWEF